MLKLYFIILISTFHASLLFTLKIFKQEKGQVKANDMNIKDKNVATMENFQIKLHGCVQGVGLRRLACSIANKMGVAGFAKYDGDGLNLTISANKDTVNIFLKKIFSESTTKAIIERFEITPTKEAPYKSFNIEESESSESPSARPTPDLGLCINCRNELFDPASAWYRFPFISCNNCGWRFSITEHLPFIRNNLTIRNFRIAPKDDTFSSETRRYLAETVISQNDHPEISMFDSNNTIIANGEEEVITAAVLLLKQGKIIALKETSCFYLIADANAENTVKNIRNRKNSGKPFNFIYPNISLIEKDFAIENHHRIELLENSGFVLLQKQAIAKLSESATLGLSKVGVMLPSSPIMALIAHDFEKPIAITSANHSGEAAFFENERYLEANSSLGDYTVLYNADMTTAQEESIIQFTNIKARKIIVRRSRGMAPNHYGYTPKSERTLLATGASTRGGFALIHNKNTFVCQNLGDSSNIQVQHSYKETLEYYRSLLKANPKVVLSDFHPNYFSHQIAEKIAEELRIPSDTIQHHKAHFAAVLAENGLFNTTSPILGVIWDGAGLGDDSNFWGGEFFLYNSGSMSRIAHLSYYPYLIGEKIAFEPRISAISLCSNMKNKENLESRFSEREWLYYNKLLGVRVSSQCSSVARLIDAVASILNLCNRQSFEDNAAILLEEEAVRFVSKNGLSKVQQYTPNNVELSEALNPKLILEEIFEDLKMNINISLIAYKFFYTLAYVAILVAKKQDTTQIAFSGSVFQIALLVDILDFFYGDEYQLFFHKQLPPNDECVSFGQLVYYDQAVDSLFSDIGLG